MLGIVRSGFKRIRRHVSGNATMMMAFGMPALVGGAGLAVDTAQWYMWERELQHSVDQAAIAGASALSNPDAEADYETRAVQEFDANQKITAAFTSAPSVTIVDFGSGSENSVVVMATATKKLPFSSFLTQAPVRIQVRAQASFTGGGAYNACLVATADNGTGLDIGGNATVIANCGMAALSCDENAVEIDGSASVETESIATCGTADVPEENEDVVTEHVHGLVDIFKDLTPPDNPTAKSYKCNSVGTGKNKTNLASLTPGTYKGLVVKCTTVLQPGIYVIDGGVLDLTANYNVTGTNVMFVLKNGATLKFGGEGNDNKITLTPMEASQFLGTAYAEHADAYGGMLVFEDRNSDPGNQDHKLTGNSNSLIEGTIYLPKGDFTVLGTANVAAQCLQVTAFRIHIKGNAQLETLCPIDEANSVGSSTASVRLVA